MIYFQIHFSIIRHVLYILKIYFQVVGIDFALNHLIKLKYFVTANSAQATVTFASFYYEFNFKNQSFISQTLNYYFHINKTLLKYRVIYRSVDKLKLNYPTYYKGKRNKFLIDRMEISWAFT